MFTVGEGLGTTEIAGIIVAVVVAVTIGVSIVVVLVIRSSNGKQKVMI